jgi:hypothetical protein
LRYLSRERFDELGGTPASVLHALKERELSLFGGRDDGFVTLRQREPAYISAFGDRRCSFRSTAIASSS